MPALRTKNPTVKKRVVAICCSDIHLSLNPPLARALEKDWFAAMARPLAEINKLVELHHGCPVLCAGDVFDHWKASPELINFAIDHLPTMYAIPGQHDLPLHRYEDMWKSAYWTLVKFGKIIHLGDELVLNINPTYDFKLALRGIPWGTFRLDELGKARMESTGDLTVALMHAFVWQGQPDAHQFAPQSGESSVIRRAMTRFDTVVIGDNHTPWDSQGKSPKLWNCGSLMRRKSDDNHIPRVGLLLDDGQVVPHELFSDEDVFTKLDPAIEKNVGDLERLVRELRGLHNVTLDFADSLRKAMDNHTSPTVRTHILKALEDGHHE